MKAEFEIVKNIKSDKIIKYFEFETEATYYKKNGFNKQVAFLVMEVIDGVDLIDFFNGIMITEEVYLRYVFRKVIEALNQLHVAGVAHRDIKPDNVMLTQKFDIKLVDLGYGIELTGRKNDG